MSLNAAALAFLKKKNISIETARLWGLDSERDLIIIPCFDDKGVRIVDAVRSAENRALANSRRYNYRPHQFMPGDAFDLREQFLFGIQFRRPGPSCFLVEGYFDAMRLFEVGYRNVFAYNGSSISVRQWRVLGNQNPIVHLIPDGDAAGRKVFDCLVPQDLTLRRVNLPEGKDPDELPIEQLEKLLGPPPFGIK